MKNIEFHEVVTLAGIYFLEKKAKEGITDNRSFEQIYSDLKCYFEQKDIRVSESLWPYRIKEYYFQTKYIRVRYLSANDINSQDYNENSISQLSFDIYVDNFDDSYNQLIDIYPLVNNDTPFGLYIFLKDTFHVESSEKIKSIFESDTEFSTDDYVKFLWQTENIVFEAYNNANNHATIAIKINDLNVTSEKIKLLIKKLIEKGVIV